MTLFDDFALFVKFCRVLPRVMETNQVRGAQSIKGKCLIFRQRIRNPLFPLSSLSKTPYLQQLQKVSPPHNSTDIPVPPCCRKPVKPDGEKAQPTNAGTAISTSSDTPKPKPNPYPFRGPMALECHCFEDDCAVCEGDGGACHVEVDGPHGEVNVCLCRTSGLPPKVPSKLDHYLGYFVIVLGLMEGMVLLCTRALK